MEDNNKKYTIMDLWIMSRTPVALVMRGSTSDTTYNWIAFGVA